MSDNTIHCPQCNFLININQVLMNDLQNKYQQEYLTKQRLLEDQMASEREALRKKETQIDLTLQERLEQELIKQKQDLTKRLTEQLQEQIRQENQTKLSLIQAELAQKNLELQKFHMAQVEIEKLKREKEMLHSSITLAKEKEMNELLKIEREKIKEQAINEQQFKLLERDKLIEDLKAQMITMQRKTESSSSERIGEVQEQALSDLLSLRFPFDVIEDVAKGQRGADIIQTIRSPLGLTCGKIYYESKRTKHFQSNWIKKLKEDNLEEKADVLIIVTDAMPNEEKKPCLEQGVWICRFSDIEWLSLVLRESLIKIQEVAVQEQGRESKMSLLYGYLTSNEFKNQFEAMFDGFIGLKNLHDTEKMRTQKIWKEREKQLERVLLNATNFYGSLKGIAGSQIPNVALLEDEEETESTPRLI